MANAWIVWVGVALFFGFIAIKSFLSVCSIRKELSTISDEGGYKWAHKRELDPHGDKPLNFGRFIMAQLENLQWSGFIGAVGAIIAAIISAFL